MITKWETLFILIITLPIMGHVVILPPLFDVAGRDAWFSIVSCIPFGLLFVWALYRLRLHYPKLYGAELITAAVGKPFGLLINLLLVCYFLFLTTLSYAALIDMVYIGFLPETPLWALIFFFFFFFIYSTLKGVKRIALTASILAVIAMFTGHTITMMDSPLKEWNRLFPLFEFGFIPAILGILVLTSIWSELLLLLFLPLENIRAKRMLLFWFIGVFLNALMMFSTTTGTITIFEVGQADNMSYPALEIVRIIGLGFIDRFDVYGLILMSFGCYIRCALFMYIANDILAFYTSNKWIKWTTFVFFSLIVLIGTFYLAGEHLRLERTLNIYAYMILLFPLPFILLGSSYVRRRKKRGKEALVK